MMTSMPMKVNEMRDRSEGVSVELCKYKESVSKYLEGMIRGVVKGLSDEYNFDEKEALTKLGMGLGLKGRRVRKIPGEVKLNKKTEKEKDVVEEGKEKGKSKEYPVPYEGVVKSECCDSLKCNGGLYTQCNDVKVSGGRYCEGCNVHMMKKGLTVPEAGTVDDRRRQDMYSYVSPGGKRQVSFGVWLKTRKVSREEWESYALERDIKISSRHFDEPVALKRGRPPSSDRKKEVDENGGKKRGRGRPRKNAELELSTASDMWSAIEQSDESPVVKESAKEETKTDVKTDVVMESEKEKETIKSKPTQEEMGRQETKEVEGKGEVRMKKKVCSKSKESYYVNLSTNEVYKYDKTSVKKGNFGSVLGKWDESSKSVIYNEAESEDEVESLGEISEDESEYE
jgi:hypothetical protein